MTDAQKANLRGMIPALVGRIEKYKGRGLGETNTKASLVEPVLETLGWDIRDPDEVHREFRPTSRDCPVDYALKLLRKPRMFIEAKGLGETLADRKWITQVLGYAIVTGVEWCVLTDGDEYRIYNATAAVDAEEKLFLSVRLSELNGTDQAVRTLGLISRADLEGNLLDVFWNAHFIDRRVTAALRSMLDNADRGLVRLIRRTAPKLGPKEIIASLRRLDVRIEAAPMPAELAASGGKPSGKVGRAKTRKGRAKPQRSEVTLLQLIAAGLLPAPTNLTRKYKGRVLEATLLADGSVEFEGVRYDSCSSAAAHARGTVSGRPMATNGWDFWLFSDGDGRRLTLDAARKKWAGLHRRTE
jgi:hypothetical protein